MQQNDFLLILRATANLKLMDRNIITDLEKWVAAPMDFLLSVTECVCHFIGRSVNQDPPRA